MTATIKAQEFLRLAAQRQGELEQVRRENQSAQKAARTYSYYRRH